MYWLLFRIQIPNNKMVKLINSHSSIPDEPFVQFFVRRKLSLKFHGLQIFKNAFVIFVLFHTEYSFYT